MAEYLTEKDANGTRIISWNNLNYQNAAERYCKETFEELRQSKDLNDYKDELLMNAIGYFSLSSENEPTHLQHSRERKRRKKIQLKAIKRYF